MTESLNKVSLIDDLRAGKDVTEEVVAALVSLEAEARRFYVPDGSYVEHDPDVVVSMRKEAAKEHAAMVEQLRELKKKIGDAHNAAFGFGADAIALEDRVRWMAQHIHDLRKAGQWLRDCFGDRPTLCKQEMLDRWDALAKGAGEEGT